MCRNIHALYNFEPPATEDEVRAAALQFVRKVSGFHKPSQANAAVFDPAAASISAASRLLFASPKTDALTRDRPAQRFAG